MYQKPNNGVDGAREEELVMHTLIKVSWEFRRESIASADTAEKIACLNDSAQLLTYDLCPNPHNTACECKIISGTVCHRIPNACPLCFPLVRLSVLSYKLKYLQGFFLQTSHRFSPHKPMYIAVSKDIPLNSLYTQV